jgi:glutamate dehydrogenase
VTVAGVGDMSGDVFGNGMLLSRAIKLVAAFDHRDIFLDPSPDPEVSWAERRRLFDLPRSSWQDYDKSLLSPGGGVFSRGAKSIPLSPEAQALLGLERAEAPPSEVMSAILRADVGLLYFGGIGTYVRAAGESDEEVGDRANDPIRITGAELRAEVIGEGANLALTQPGRIEAALKGVRLNTDAIDNSAGVNTSDVEVNIKIALKAPERDGRLPEAERNALLAAMTDEVARLVLRNNYLQTLALSLAERQGLPELGFAQRLMQGLERQGRLDRAVEDLPDDATLVERRRRNEALTRPELAVLLAYAKLSLHDELLRSPVPDDPYLGRELERYFPLPCASASPTRSPVTACGARSSRPSSPTPSSTGAARRSSPASSTRPAPTRRRSPRLTPRPATPSRLSRPTPPSTRWMGRCPGALQLQLYGELQRLLMHRIVWFIRHVDLLGRLEEVIARYRAGIDAVERALPQTLSSAAREGLTARSDALVAQGVPSPLEPAARGLAGPGGGARHRARRRADGPPRGGDRRDPLRRREPVRLGQPRRRGPRSAGERHLRSPGARPCDRRPRRRPSRITAEVVGKGPGGSRSRSRLAMERGGAEAERIRAAIEGIVVSGLTLSKVTVASSLLGDLARA